MHIFTVDATGMTVKKDLICQKYNIQIETENNPCPHPGDYCKFRTWCIIHMRCMEDDGCREKRRKAIENTR